jgi:hypothetical protein
MGAWEGGHDDAVEEGHSSYLEGGGEFAGSWMEPMMITLWRLST